MSDLTLRAVKINVLFLIRRKNKKGGGREVFFFFNTEEMILDHTYNEWTETVYEYRWPPIVCV